METQPKEEVNKKQGIKVKRSPDMSFKCDACGDIFEGDGAQDRYKEHMANENFGVFTLDDIKEPETMRCVINTFDRPLDEKTEREVAEIEDDGSLDALLNKLKAVKKDVVQHTQYVCKICKKKSMITNEPLLWSFDNLDIYDEHLFTLHKLMVKRESELVVINVDTGDKWKS